MSEQSLELIHPVVNFVDGKTMTTSLNIADVFGIKHKHILDSIQKLDAPEEFTEPNFRPCEYTGDNGQKLPMYNITRDGFMLLAMGFTGKQAMRFKIAYIGAFNRMESALMARKPELPDEDLLAGHEIHDSILQEVKSAASRFNATNRLRLLHSVTQMSRVDQTMPHTRVSILLDYARMCEALADDEAFIGEDGSATIKRFVEQCCLRDKEETVTADVLYKRYCRWCASDNNGRGRSSPPRSATWFGREMRKRFKKYKSNGCVVYEGIGLKD